MRLYTCKACQRGVYVLGDVEEVEFLLKGKWSVPCVTPLCRGTMIHSPNTMASTFVCTESQVRDFYRAVHGFGPPAGAPATMKRLQEVLTTQMVARIVGESVGKPERVIVKELVMESGARLHFETSARGACCYYIEEACNERVVGESPHPRGEEAGRAAEAHDGGPEGSVQEPLPSVPDPTGQPVSGGVPSVPEADHVLGSAGPGDERDVPDSPVRV